MSLDKETEKILLEVGRDYEDLGIGSEDMPAQAMLLADEIECSMVKLPELVAALPAAHERTKASEGPEDPGMLAYADAERRVSGILGYMRDGAKALRHLLYSFRQPVNCLSLVRGRCSSLARAAEDMNSTLVFLDPEKPDYAALERHMEHMSWLCGEIGEGTRRAMENTRLAAS